MKSMIVRKAGEMPVEVEREMPQPGPGEVRVRVRACGVCHSDRFVVEALWPGLELPRVPGHEVAGEVDAVGSGVTGVSPGDRVGLGWHGGHDGTCGRCLAGEFIHCEAAGITGITLDGGYSEYLVAPAIALARIPEGMDYATAAPLMCAGVTTFNALRHSGARAGDVVAIQGLGGLGHLGVQYASAMGFEVVAISRGTKKESFARELGAAHYVDASSPDFGPHMQKIGAPKVILATAPHAEAVSPLVAQLALNGCLMVVAAPFEPLSISAIDLISGDRRVQGWSSGTTIDSTDAMSFAQRHGVKPMIETFPLAKAGRAYQRMHSGEVRFRSVIVLD